MRFATVFLLFCASVWGAIPASITRCRVLDKTGGAAEPCFRALTQTSNPFERAEGFWGIGQFKEANEQFKAAVAVQPSDPDRRVRWGRLFLERFSPSDATGLFKEALAIDADHAGALLGLALIASEGFDKQAVEFATKALAADPKLVEAQELLARLALEDSDLEKAIAEADKAMAMSKEALDAMAIRAAVDLLQNKPESEWFAKIAAVNPRYGEAWMLVGNFLVLNRRYEEGIAHFRKALELKPTLHEARSQLGINLMRLGEEKEAYQQLETAFNAGYHDNATKNSLVLMDSYKRFDTFTTPRTIVKLDRREAELLRPYFEGELERAITVFEKKYKMKLKHPVKLEVYPDHEDFAVRTMGMPGLGALGVTFGHVVAMDSPSGRKPGSFHWASTLWHELSHVFVLSATNHRVPRWFTEGMAVHEETAISPDWGDRLDPEAIRAIKEKKLLPVAQLDRGFIRPSYPSQVIVSYFQAGRICDYIAEKWSYDKLLEMIAGFAQAKSTPEVMKAALGVTTEEFDTQFIAWLEGKTKKTVEGFAEWRKRARALNALKEPDAIIKEAEELVDIYPDFVDAGSVYETLAEAYVSKGDKKSAMHALERFSSVGGRDVPTLLKLSSWQEEAGKKAEAARTLERLLYIYPINDVLHAKLGKLYLETGNFPGAVREYNAALALKPVDQAGTRFSLAQALKAANRTEEAKEQVLLALEAAPGFKPAQKLLLELSR